MVWQRGVGPIINQESLFTNFDRDFDVDGDDLAIWDAAFGLNDKGDVDLGFGHIHHIEDTKTSGFRVAAIALASTAATVPEPTGLVLWSIAVLVVTSGRLRLAMFSRRWHCAAR